jgi:hypothetical protein
VEKNNQDNQISYSTVDIIKIFKSHSRIFITIFVITISLSVLYFFIKKPVYKTEMIVTSSIVTSERLAILVDPLSDLVEEKNFSELAALMNIDSTTASFIKGIEAKEIKDELKASASQGYDSEILRQQNCLVVLKVKSNPKLADTIQSGILNYLRNNNYVKRKSANETQSLEFEKTRIQLEIKALDTLKFKITNNISELSSMMDPSAINNSIANLYHRELGINSKLLLEDGGINIIRDVTRLKSPIEPKLWLCVFVGILMGFILSLTTVIIQEFKNKYLSELNEN